METRSKNELQEAVIRKAWESEEFKQQLFTDPKKALNELGYNIPHGTEISVFQEYKNKMVLVLPENPLQAMSEMVIIEELGDTKMPCTMPGHCFANNPPVNSQDQCEIVGIGSPTPGLPPTTLHCQPNPNQPGPNQPSPGKGSPKPQGPGYEPNQTSSPFCNAETPPPSLPPTQK